MPTSISHEIGVRAVYLSRLGRLSDPYVSRLESAALGEEPGALPSHLNAGTDLRELLMLLKKSVADFDGIVAEVGNEIGVPGLRLNLSFGKTFSSVGGVPYAGQEEVTFESNGKAFFIGNATTSRAFQRDPSIPQPGTANLWSKGFLDAMALDTEDAGHRLATDAEAAIISVPATLVQKLHDMQASAAAERKAGRPAAERSFVKNLVTAIMGRRPPAAPGDPLGQIEVKTAKIPRPGTPSFTRNVMLPLKNTWHKFKLAEDILGGVNPNVLLWSQYSPQIETVVRTLNIVTQDVLNQRKTVEEARRTVQTALGSLGIELTDQGVRYTGFVQPGQKPIRPGPPGIVKSQTGHVIGGPQMVTDNATGQQRMVQTERGYPYLDERALLSLDRDVINIMAGEMNPRTGSQLVAVAARYQEVSGRPVVGGKMLTQQFVMQEGQITGIGSAQILQRVRQKFEQHGGGSVGAREASKELLKLTSGMPSMGLPGTTTAAYEARAKQAVTVPQGAWQEVRSPQAMVSQISELGQYVGRGAQPEYFAPTETMTAVPGWTGEIDAHGNMRIYAGEQAAGKPLKRAQQAFRDMMLRASKQSNRNVVAPFRMEGATRSEWGQRFRTGIVSFLPEGVGHIDADLLRKMGPMETPVVERIRLIGTEDFQPSTSFQSSGGKIVIGTSNGKDVPYDVSDFAGFDVRGVRVVSQGGQRFVEIHGTGKIDPNSDVIKAWLGAKAITTGMQGLTERMVVGARGVEAMMPIFKNTRQGAFITLWGYYGSMPNGNERLIADLKEEGIDVVAQGMVESYGAEDHEIAKNMLAPGQALPSRRVVWNAKLDRYAYRLAERIISGSTADRTVNLPMSYEAYTMLESAIGDVPGIASIKDKISLRVDDPSGWSATPQTRQQVKTVAITGPMPVMDIVFQFGQQHYGKTGAMSFETLEDTLRYAGLYGKEYKDAITKGVLPRMLARSAKHREYYTSWLESVLVTHGSLQRKTMDIHEFKTRMSAFGGSFADKLRMLPDDVFIDIGGVVLPPGKMLARIATPGALERMIGGGEYQGQQQDVDRDTAIYSVQMNKILNGLQRLVTPGKVSSPDAMIDEIAASVGELFTTRTAVRGMRELRGVGVEAPYTSYHSLRPHQVVLGERMARQIFGTSDVRTISSMLSQAQRGGFKIVGLGQRMPATEPLTGTSIPLEILTVEEARRRGMTDIPREFGGMAFSQLLMDPMKGDFDGDRAAVFLATAFVAGRFLTEGAVSGAASERGMLHRLYTGYEVLTGTRVAEGERSIKDYLDRMIRMRADTGADMSEVANWMMKSLRKLPSVETLIGTEEKFTHPIAGEELITSGLSGILGKKATGYAYNLAARGYKESMTALGLWQHAGAANASLRVRYAVQQVTADVSTGSPELQKLMVLASTYTPRMTKKGTMGAYLPQTFSVNPESEWINFGDLPKYIIETILKTPEFGGLSDKPINTALLSDISWMLARDKETANAIHKILWETRMSPKGVAASRIVDDVFGGIRGFWRRGGPMQTTIGSLMTRRMSMTGRKPEEALETWYKDPQWTQFDEKGNPIGGFGFFKELWPLMDAAKRLASGRSGMIERRTGREKELFEQHGDPTIPILSDIGQFARLVTPITNLLREASYTKFSRMVEGRMVYAEPSGDPWAEKKAPATEEEIEFPVGKLPPSHLFTGSVATQIALDIATGYSKYRRWALVPGELPFKEPVSHTYRSRPTSMAESIAERLGISAEKAMRLRRPQIELPERRAVGYQQSLPFRERTRMAGIPAMSEEIIKAIKSLPELQSIGLWMSETKAGEHLTKLFEQASLQIPPSFRNRADPTAPEGLARISGAEGQLLDLLDELGIAPDVASGMMSIFTGAISKGFPVSGALAQAAAAGGLTGIQRARVLGLQMEEPFPEGPMASPAGFGSKAVGPGVRARPGSPSGSGAGGIPPRGPAAPPAEPPEDPESRRRRLQQGWESAAEPAQPGVQPTQIGVVGQQQIGGQQATIQQIISSAIGEMIGGKKFIGIPEEGKIFTVGEQTMESKYGAGAPAFARTIVSRAQRIGLGPAIEEMTPAMQAAIGQVTKEGERELTGTGYETLTSIATGRLPTVIKRLEAFAKLGEPIAGEEAGAAGQLLQARLKQPTKEMLAFTEALSTTRKSLSAYSTALDEARRIVEPGELEKKPLTREETTRIRETFKQLSRVATTAQAAGAEVPREYQPLIAQMSRIQSQMERNLVEFGTEFPGAQRVGRLQRAARGIFGGDIGQLSWGMFNVQRAWALTAGQVQRQMQQYAGYSAAQQQAAMTMGAQPGFAGAPAQMLGAQAGLQQFGLGVGRAAWDIWGWVPRGLGAVFGGRPDQPGPVERALAGAGPVAGLYMGGGMLSNLAARGTFGAGLQGVGAAAGTGLAGLAGALPMIATVAGGAYAGYELSQALGLLDEEEGFGRVFGLGVGMVPRAGAMMHLETARRLGVPREERSRWARGWERLVEPFEEWGRPAAPEPWATGMEEFRERVEERAGRRITPGSVETLAAAIAQSAGVSREAMDETMALKDAMVDATSAMIDLPKEMQQQVLQLGVGAARARGWAPGGIEAPQLMAQFAQMGPQQRLAAERGVQVFGQYAGFLQAGGVTPSMEQITAPMGAAQEYRLGALMQGDPRMWARAGRAYGVMPAVTTEAAAPYVQLGRLTTAELMTPQTIQQANLLMGGQLTPEVQAMVGGIGAGGAAGLEAQQRQVQYQWGVTQQQRQLQQFGLRQAMETGRMAIPRVTGITPTGVVEEIRAPAETFAQAGQLMAAGGGMGRRGLEDVAIQQAREYQLAQFRLARGTGGPMRRGVFAGVRMPQIDWSQVSVEPPSPPEYDEEGRLVQQPMPERVRQEGRALRISVRDAVIRAQNLSVRELGQMGLQDRQFMESWLLGGRMQARRFDWGAEDIERQRERGLVRLGWAEQDLRTGFGRQQTQFGWQAEDIAFQGAQRSIQFGWGMEDIEEQMRYATGRQRRRLMRQRERQVIGFGMGMGQLERQDERLQQRKQWAEEDFNKELERIQIRRGWLEEDYERAKARLEEQMGWNEESHQLQLKHHHERMELAYERQAITEEHYEATFENQERMRELNRKYWDIEMANQAEHIKNASAYNSALAEIQVTFVAIKALMEARGNEFKSLMGSGGAFREAYADFVDYAIEYTLGRASAMTAEAEVGYDTHGAIP